MVATATRPATNPGGALAGRLIRCVVGERAFFLPLARVAEIVALGRTATTAPRGWIGTLVRNERPVPIGDLAFLLDLARQTGGRGDSRALILRGAGGGISFGVTVETVPTVLNVDARRPVPLPPSARRGDGDLVRGSLIVGDELLLQLDPDAIVARLAAGIVQGPDGRITELRALPRRASGELGRPSATAGTPPPRPPRRDLPVLLLAGVETADGGARFAPAVPMTWVQEVRPQETPLPLPHAPGAVSGLLRWRDLALPAIDLTRRLTGLPDDGDGASKRRTLIVGPQGTPPVGALLVPGVAGLRTLAPLPAADAPPLPETLDTGVLSAWTGHDGEAVAVLDLAALFA